MSYALWLSHQIGKYQFLFKSNEHLHLGDSTHLILKTGMSQPPAQNHMAAESIWVRVRAERELVKTEQRWSEQTIWQMPFFYYCDAIYYYYGYIVVFFVIQYHCVSVCLATCYYIKHNDMELTDNFTTTWLSMEVAWGLKYKRDMWLWHLNIMISDVLSILIGTLMVEMLLS